MENSHLEMAIKTLYENIERIDRVSEWAVACGFNDAKKFSRCFRNHFGFRPSVVMKNIKVRIAIKHLSQNQLSNYEIALKIGKSNEKSLYHFIKRQTGNAPKFYKRKKS